MKPSEAEAAEGTHGLEPPPLLPALEARSVDFF